jgi:hypothetical protein
MTLEQVWEALLYRGDARVAADGQNDLHALTAETVQRLPRQVQRWLLSETDHIFVGGHGQPATYHELTVPVRESEGGRVKVRMVFLSERLMGLPREEAARTIAREIAHSWQTRKWSGRHRHGVDYEAAVDRLVQRWGFAEPASSPGAASTTRARRKRPIAPQAARPIPRVGRRR